MPPDGLHFKYLNHQQLEFNMHICQNFILEHCAQYITVCFNSKFIHIIRSAANKIIKIPTRDLADNEYTF